MSRSSVASALWEETLAVASIVARAALGGPDLLLAHPSAGGGVGSQAQGRVPKPACSETAAVRGTQLAFALEEESKTDRCVRQTGISDRRGHNPDTGTDSYVIQTDSFVIQSQGDRHRGTDVSD